ncbi:hypothetical protein DMB91_08075 [Campylobacter sp. MIT 97-5078]|nr:hypothetical protein LR59_09275 [Campylobacter sp. MIT 97-5078]TQR23556.1 hypothetical protein DMB91_08075 [Campylobacter sp. MIT 97-5078]
MPRQSLAYMRMDLNQNFDETTLIATGTNNTSFKKLKFPYDKVYVYENERITTTGKTSTRAIKNL